MHSVYQTECDTMQMFPVYVLFIFLYAISIKCVVGLKKNLKGS